MRKAVFFAVPALAILLVAGLFAEYSSADVILITGEKSRSKFELGKSNSELFVAQSFKVNSQVQLKEISFGLARRNSPQQPLTVSLRTALTGADLAKKDLPAQSSISTDSDKPTWLVADFPNSITLQPGTLYFVVLSVPYRDGNNYYWVTVDKNSYSEGDFYRKGDPVSDLDMLMELRSSQDVHDSSEPANDTPSSGQTSTGTSGGSTTGSTGSTSSGPAPLFIIGDTVQVLTSLNVRNSGSLSGSNLGAQPAGAQGVITGGPVSADDYLWWNINYTSGSDGWSAQDFLGRPFTHEGFGSTKGGEGGKVIRVTSLAEDGPGTLREALSQSGKKTILFDVGGTIELRDELDVKDAYVTIDATSAPSPVTLNGAGLKINGILSQRVPNDVTVHDVIVRGLRIRNAKQDGIQIAWGAYNILIDQVSVTSSKDGNIDITHGAHDVTVQYSLMGNNLKNMLLKTQNPLNEVPAETERISLHHNIIAGSTNRNPIISHVKTGSDMATDVTVDMRNNIVANWGTGVGISIECGAKANIVNNLLTTSNSSALDKDQNILIRPAVPTSGSKFTCHDSVPNGPSYSGQAYVSGNINELNELLSVYADITWSDPSKQVSNPYFAPTVSTTDACNAAKSIIGKAGVRPLDSSDQSLISAIKLPGNCPSSPTPSPSPTPTPAPASTAALTAQPSSITAGGSSVLSWTSTNATACSATGAWSGAKAISGSQTVTPGSTSTYKIVCTGNGGSADASVTVTVTSVTPPTTTPPETTPVPTVSLSASPNSITTNGSGNTVLSWNSTNATSCTASGAWSGAKALSGSQTVTLNATSNYVLTCTGAGGSTSANASVSIFGVAGPPITPPSGGDDDVDPDDFTEDLYLGLRHKQVLKLQKALNKLGFLVAESGPGSPGNETDYFGLATKKAVIKFQKKYEKKMLTPLGLTDATGYFGALSKQQLKDILAELERGELAPDTEAQIREDIQKMLQKIQELQAEINAILNGGSSSPTPANIRFEKMIIPVNTLTSGNHVLYKFRITPQEEVGFHKFTFSVATTGVVKMSAAIPNFTLWNVGDSKRVGVAVGTLASYLNDPNNYDGNKNLLVRIYADTTDYTNHWVPVETSRTFELRADITSDGTNDSITTKLLGDTVTAKGTATQVDTAGANIIWTDFAADATGTHSLSTSDWMSGHSTYGITGLLATGLDSSTLSN